MSAEILFQNFDLLAAAQNGVQKLRELILQLAMQGKLIPQDPTDEPATILIDKIRREKKRLIGAGSDGNSSPVSKDETPYSLPVSWQWVRLGDVQVFTNGFAFQSTDYRTSGVGIIRMSELGNDWNIDESDMKFIPTEQAKQLPAQFFVKPNDLLMGMSGSIGKLAINRTGKTFLLNQRVGRLEPILILKHFLFYFLQTAEKRYLDISFGMAIKNLSTKQINETPFPLPPLNEQRRIVAKVDQLMALCDELEEKQKKRNEARISLNASALDHLLAAKNPQEFDTHWQRISTNFDLLFDKPETVGKLRQAVLQLAVQGKLVPQDPKDEPATVLLEKIKAEKERLVKEKKIKKSEPLPPIAEDEVPYELPKGWVWCRMDNLCELITKGSSPKWQGISYTDKTDGILFVTSENVGSYRMILDEPKFVERKFNKIEPRSILKRNDILMNIVGASIGRTALFDSDDTANINQAVCLIRLLSQDRHLSLDYFLYFFNSPLCISYMFDKQVENARANLSMGNIARFAIPLPPFDEQLRIATKVSELLTICDDLETNLTHAGKASEELVEAVVREVVA